MFSKFKHSLKKAFIPPDDNAAFAAPEGYVRPKVYFDISIGQQAVGRIIMELFTDVTPKTCENFLQLCTNTDEHSYNQTLFHRVIPDFMIQGGDIINGDGTGTWSIYGGAFADENFKILHTVPGLLSMANSGPNTNGCQFFITCAEADFLDGKHVVFGRVVEGMPVVREIESTPTGQNDRPQTRVTISACGKL